MKCFWTTTREEEWIGKAGKPQELSGSFGNYLGRTLSVSTTVHGPSTSVGMAAVLCRCSGLRARSLQRIPRHITRAHFSSQGASRIIRALSHPPGFPTQSRSSLVGQCPRRHRRQLLQSCKTTWQPARSPLLHKATFSRLGERAILHIHKQT